jgi:hypothetical protein
LYYPVYRLNTYPLLHKNVFHFLLNSIALTPLLERFEMENGTIVTLLLFTGPFGLLPGLIYTGLERFIFRSNSAVIGASIWVFLLLCVEAIKTYRQNPAFTIGDYAIPTWTTPLFIIFVIHFLVPNTSLLGHLCGALVGYLWGLGWIKFLAPSEKILRWVEGKLWRASEHECEQPECWARQRYARRSQRHRCGTCWWHSKIGTLEVVLYISILDACRVASYRSLRIKLRLDGRI